MTTSEHLNKIKSKCESLLELASKRTLGKWAKNTYKPHVAGESVTHSVDGPPSDFMYLQEESDAAFIASCAGPAEAGWRDTSSLSHGTSWHGRIRSVFMLGTLRPENNLRVAGGTPVTLFLRTLFLSGM